MGRELKRVPLDFDWPVNKTWDGFLNEHYEKCPSCDGMGTTWASQRLDCFGRLLHLSYEDAKGQGRMHPYFNEGGFYSKGKPGEDMVELITGLGQGEKGEWDEDRVDTWNIIKRIIRAAGLEPGVWGQCPDCDDGIPLHAKEAYDAWEETPVPEGEAYQIWETVSEGSPISPPFETPQELAQYLCLNNRGVDEGTSYDQWLNFIEGPGWAPSMIISSEHGIQTGVQAGANK